MKQSDAVRHLRVLMYAMQKARSVARETGLISSNPNVLALSDRVAGKMWPWLMGDKNLLPALEKLINNVDDGQPLAPQDYYNIISVATRLEPSLSVMAAANDETFPQEADINWLGGWEPEDKETE